jgi:hypothetical protein
MTVQAQTLNRDDYSRVAQTSGHRVRLSPENLPHHFHFQTTQGDRLSSSTVHLTQDCVHISHLLPSGLPVALDIPVLAFEAVAVRVLPGDAPDTIHVVLELMHADPALSVPLAISADFEDLIADWRAGGSVFHLPLVLVEADGSAHTVENRMGAVVLRQTAPRRRSVLTGRRPRFLSRRRTGRADLLPVLYLDEREITSWE